MNGKMEESEWSRPEDKYKKTKESILNNEGNEKVDKFSILMAQEIKVFMSELIREKLNFFI